MRCNGCQEDLAESKQQCVATSCLHMFCGTCIQKIVETEAGCPVCENVITKNNIKLVRVLQDAQSLKLALCGQTPDVALSTALNAVQFYITQQAIQAELQAMRLNQKVDKMKLQCNVRLQEVHDGYMKAKRKYKEIAEERNKLAADNQELQQKYSQKAAQTRKLQDMYQALQQEYEALRSQGSRGGQLHNLLGDSPGNVNRSSGGGQLVTTYHRKQVFLGDDARDLLGQKGLDHNRRDSFQGFLTGNLPENRGGVPTPQRIFGGLPERQPHRTSPSISPLLRSHGGVMPPSRPNHLGHLLGEASGYNSGQKRSHDIFRSASGRHGPSTSGMASL